MKSLNSIINKQLVVLCLVLGLSASIFAQDQGCPTKKLPDYLTRDYPEPVVPRSTPIRHIVKLYVRVINEDDGSGGVAIDDLYRELNRLEAYFAPHDICFMLTGTDAINDSYYASYNDFNCDDECPFLDNELAIDHPPVDKSITIYILPDYTSFRGWSSGKYICISADRFETPHLAHEIGHSLGLLHTHQGADTSTQNDDELVDGSNCEDAGDRLCDTPADPKLSRFNVNEVTCAYTGTARDRNGHLYRPDVTNIMSYAPFACRGFFTPMQVRRMRNRIENYWLPKGYTVTANGWSVHSLVKYSGRSNYTSKNEITAYDLDLGGSAKVNLVGRDYITIYPDSYIHPGNNGKFEARVDYFCNGVFPDVNGGIDEAPPRTALHLEENEQIVEEGNPFQVFPIPANDKATVRYYLDQPQKTVLKVCDALGAPFEKFVVDEQQDAGWNEVPLNTSLWKAGTYYISLKLARETINRKIIVVH